MKKIKSIIKRINKKYIIKFLNTVKTIGIKSAIRKVFNCKQSSDEFNKNYQNWIKENEPDEKELNIQKNTKFKYEPKISIVVPLYNTPINFFIELVESVKKQTYSNWELCFADGSDNKNSEIENVIKNDTRIKYKFLGKNLGISGNTNEAIKMAKGDFIGLLDHDDKLPIFSLFEIVECINNNLDVEFIYTDEDKISEDDDKRFDPYFKPDFSIDLLRSNNYICHFSIFKKTLMDKLQGERSKYNGAQDFDIILRMTEMTNNIIHIPKILYHWRVHKSSTAMIGGDAKPYAFEAGITVINDYLKRNNLKGTVEHGTPIGTYRVKYEVKGNPKVSILIPNKDYSKMLKKCVKTILEKTTYKNFEIIIIENNSIKKETFKMYEKLQKNEKIKILYFPEKEFNYSKIINYGVRNCDGEYIVQLNNDTKLLTCNWLEEMLGFAQREDVGAVGIKLYYPNNKIQHAGLVVGVNQIAGTVALGLNKYEYGYFARENIIQNFSAVTAACIMSNRKIYDEVNFMSEEFAVAFNDVDFCLKIREIGKLIVYTPFVEMIHYESKTRGYEESCVQLNRFNTEIELFKSKWKSFLKSGDPYYNKNFSKKNANHEL